MPRPTPCHSTHHVPTHFHSYHGLGGSHYSSNHYTLLHLGGKEGGATAGPEVEGESSTYSNNCCHLLQNYYMLGKVVPHINGWTTTTFGGTLLT